MRNYTDITVLLDRSGSMQSIKAAMESGFDEFVGQHKQNPTTQLTLIQFDGIDDQAVSYTARPVADVPRLSLDPRGWTPLLDAFCKAIDATGSRLAKMAERERPNKVLFLIVTDGQENRSKTYKREDVRARVEKQQNTYNWEFVYLGANQDAIMEAQTFGITADRALYYTGDVACTTGTWRELTKNTVAYANTGAVASLDWNQSQRDEATKSTT